MNPDYLWDPRSEPDPEIQRLEHLLIEFRSTRSAPSLPVRSRMRWSAIAAAVLVVAGGTWLASRKPPEGWQVAREGSATTRLAVGQTLETGADGHATVNVGDIGVVEVEPNSRLRLLRARNNEHRMALDRGLIQAFIWAPPRSFVVDTPSAVAVDLGCYYTLQVADDGAGLVTVLSGWVGFERDGRESFIPAGALCRTRPHIGPGTPYREQASAAFRDALQEFDFAHGGDAALDTVLSEATKDDAFTLWHLLSRGNPAQRQRVFETLAALVPPPAGVTREGILAGSRKMLDRWWDQLGFGNTTWWRQFESTWPAATR